MLGGVGGVPEQSGPLSRFLLCCCFLRLGFKSARTHNKFVRVNRQIFCNAVSTYALINECVVVNCNPAILGPYDGVAAVFIQVSYDNVAMVREGIEIDSITPIWWARDNHMIQVVDKDFAVSILENKAMLRSPLGFAVKTQVLL